MSWVAAADDRRYLCAAVPGNRVTNGELRKHELSVSGGGTLTRVHGSCWSRVLLH
jgi:hypothetical protein